MGRYINVLSNGQKLGNIKAGWLITHEDAVIVDGKTFQENLVCVVNNGGWEAAAWAYDEREYEYLKRGLHDRPHVWLVVTNVKNLVNE